VRILLTAVGIPISEYLQLDIGVFNVHTLTQGEGSRMRYPPG
jgi:hypothetical protein